MILTGHGSTTGYSITIYCEAQNTQTRHSSMMAQYSSITTRVQFRFGRQLSRTDEKQHIPQFHKGGSKMAFYIKYFFCLVSWHFYLNKLLSLHKQSLLRESWYVLFRVFAGVSVFHSTNTIGWEFIFSLIHII